MSDLVVRALAVLGRRQLVQMKLSEETRDVFPDSYVYAVVHGVFPYFHMEDVYAERDELLEWDPFASTYRVPKAQVEELMKFLDDREREGDPPSFYDLETRYRDTWRGGYLRVDLIHCLRYAHLDRRFGEDCWQAIRSDGPVEANGITDDVGLDDWILM